MQFWLARRAGGDFLNLSSSATHRNHLAASPPDGVTVIPDAAPVVLAAIFGALCGVVAGFILARLIRFGAYLTGRHFVGNNLILISGVAGAVVFVWFTLARGRL